jgi:hypothetical protein
LALGVGRWIAWALGFGRWVAHRPVIGRWVRWVLQGGDDEVSGRDTLRGAFVRRSEARLTLASRSVGVHFLGVGCLGVGRWVGRWALGSRQGHPRALGWRRGHFTGTSIARFEAPLELVTTT